VRGGEMICTSTCSDLYCIDYKGKAEIVISNNKYVKILHHKTLELLEITPALKVNGVV
jgi:hypothetical protein